MDFVVVFPRTRRQYNSKCVLVDSLTKSAYFISVKSSYSVEDNASIFIDDIVCIHGIPLSIISDRDAQLKSKFWRSFQKGLCTKVKLSTAFPPQMDGKTEHTIQTLEDMIRGLIINFKGSWDKILRLVEFSYNNS